MFPFSPYFIAIRFHVEWLLTMFFFDVSTCEKCCFSTDKDTSRSCGIDNGGCEHNCTQLTPTSFYCSCFSGFEISSENRKTCKGNCCGD